MITKETAIVYRGGGRRWLTLNAAVKAEAIVVIKKKHPSERGNMTYPECDPGFYWRELPRSDVLLRRMCRVIRASSDIKAAP